MPLLIRKLDNFVLYRRAVAGSDSLYLTAIKRGSFDAVPKNPVTLGGGVPQVATDLLAVNLLGQKRERSRLSVTGLLLKAVPVNRPAVKTRRSYRS